MVKKKQQELKKLMKNKIKYEIKFFNFFLLKFF